MACENNNSFTKLLGAALVIGLSILGSSFMLKEGIINKNHFEFKQEGPVFIRFNKNNGEMCYTGLAPDGKFATESWLCMAGNKVKEGEAIDLQKPSKTDSSSKTKKENK